MFVFFNVYYTFWFWNSVERKFPFFREHDHGWSLLSYPSSLDSIYAFTCIYFVAVIFVFLISSNCLHKLDWNIPTHTHTQFWIAPKLGNTVWKLMVYKIKFSLSKRNAIKMVHHLFQVRQAQKTHLNFFSLCRCVLFAFINHFFFFLFGWYSFWATPKKERRRIKFTKKTD